MSKWYDQHLVETSDHHFGGKQRVFRFENGYGASVIPEFEIREYDSEELEDPEGKPHDMKPIKGMWEIAVLLHDELCYDTSITDDVLRRQNDPEVDNILGMISRL